MCELQIRESQSQTAGLVPCFLFHWCLFRSGTYVGRARSEMGKLCYLHMYMYVGAREGDNLDLSLGAWCFMLIRAKSNSGLDAYCRFPSSWRWANCTVMLVLSDERRSHMLISMYYARTLPNTTRIWLSLNYATTVAFQWSEVLWVGLPSKRLFVFQARFFKKTKIKNLASRGDKMTE